MDIAHILYNYVIPVVEIALISAMFYIFYLLLHKTKAVRVFKGLVILGIAFFAARLLNLYTIDWVLTKLLTFSALAFLVVFQPELRFFLERLGQGYYAFKPEGEESIVDVLVKAVFAMAEKKIGALIVFERNVSLKNYFASGVRLDSSVSAEILQTIFTPSTPLHDGGVIIHANRIVAASCLFPLSQRPDLSRSLGTRHRAAVGLSEETDALIVVVSEETGTVSLARDGSISRNLDRERLHRVLTNLYMPEQKQKSLLELTEE